MVAVTRWRGFKCIWRTTRCCWLSLFESVTGGHPWRGYGIQVRYIEMLARLSATGPDRDIGGRVFRLVAHSPGSNIKMLSLR